MTKKIIKTTVAATIITVTLSACNKQIVDFTLKFDYAYIELPGGEIVEGKVQSWRDYDDGDQLQITIDGKTYLTDSTRCVLVANK